MSSSVTAGALEFFGGIGFRASLAKTKIRPLSAEFPGITISKGEFSKSSFVIRGTLDASCPG